MGGDLDVDKHKLIEQEIKQFHKKWFAEYVAKVLEIEYRINGDGRCNSIRSVYNSCLDTITYSDDEVKDIYQQVNVILRNKYQFLIAGYMDDEEHIYLVDTKEKVEVKHVKSSYISRKTNKRTRNINVRGRKSKGNY